MQIIRVQTNIRLSDIPEKFENEISYELAKAMDLSPDKFMVIIEGAMRIGIGSSKDVPVAFVNFITTRPSSQSENDSYAKKITSILKEKLKLDSEKVIITFDYKDAKSIAVQGKTIASLYS